MDQKIFMFIAKLTVSLNKGLQRIRFTYCHKTGMLKTMPQLRKEQNIKRWHLKFWKPELHKAYLADKRK